MLVSSWARLGSGNRPFLLLRIWRIKYKHTTQREKDCVCVLMWPSGAPDGSTNYYKSLHPVDLSALLPEMLEKEGRIKLQNSTFTGTLQMLSFIVLPEMQLSV